MANTILNNKVRNPKDLSKWLDIWTANIADKNNQTNEYEYIIIPSSKWKIPFSYSSQNECLTLTYTINENSLPS